MRLIVTRPMAQAEAAVRDLRAAGVDAQALPLIAIDALPDDRAHDGELRELVADLRRARESLAARRLVMFVSANAVLHFFGIGHGPDPATPQTAALRWPPGTLAGSTGPGTTAALCAAGVPAACLREPAADAPRLDSEALWQQLRGLDWRGAGVLVVRGEGGRDWLAETLRAAGAEVEFVTAYRRVLPKLTADQAAWLAAALADPAGHVWHFSSSEAVHNLRQLAPGGRWRESPALATHPRIAEAARAEGFGQVQVLAPGLPALLEAWGGLQTRAGDAAS